MLLRVARRRRSPRFARTGRRADRHAKMRREHERATDPAHAGDRTLRGASARCAPSVSAGGWRAPLAAVDGARRRACRCGDAGHRLRDAAAPRRAAGHGRARARRALLGRVHAVHRGRERRQPERSRSAWKIAVDAIEADLKVEDLPVGRARLASPVRLPALGTDDRRAHRACRPRRHAARRGRDRAPRGSRRWRAGAVAMLCRGLPRSTVDARFPSRAPARWRGRARRHTAMTLSSRRCRGSATTSSCSTAFASASTWRRRTGARLPTGTSASAATRCWSWSVRRGMPISATGSSIRAARRSSIAATARAASSCSSATRA